MTNCISSSFVLWAASDSSVSFASSVSSFSFFSFSVEALMTIRSFCLMIFFFFVFSISQIESIVFHVISEFSIEVSKWSKIERFCFMSFLTFLTRSFFFFLTIILLTYIFFFFRRHMIIKFLCFFFFFSRFFLSFFSTIACFAVFLMSFNLSIVDLNRWRKMIFWSRSSVLRLNRTLSSNSWRCDFAIISFAFSTNSANSFDRAESLHCVIFWIFESHSSSSFWTSSIVRDRIRDESESVDSCAWFRVAVAPRISFFICSSFCSIICSSRLMRIDSLLLKVLH